MNARKTRILIVLLGLLGIGSATALISKALQTNMTYYYTPSKVVAGEAPEARVFRIGGMVEPNSLVRDTDSLGVEFVVTDYKQRVKVRYEGILPDLFKEQQAAVARGKLSPEGVFIAEEVLAKHDASYMPPEVAESLGMKGDNVNNEKGYR